MTENQSLGPLFEPGELSRIIDDALNAAAKKVGPLTRRRPPSPCSDRARPPRPGSGSRSIVGICLRPRRVCSRSRGWTPKVCLRRPKDGG